jgi:hypothetical protein
MPVSIAKPDSNLEKLSKDTSHSTRKDIEESNMRVFGSKGKTKFSSMLCPTNFGVVPRQICTPDMIFGDPRYDPEYMDSSDEEWLANEAKKEDEK